MKCYLQLKEENDRLKKTIKQLNERLGDEIIEDSEESTSSVDGTEYKTLVNTRHYQRDELFASRCFYITDVGEWRYFMKIKWI